MASPKFQRKKRISETEGGNFGNYEETNGGGSPKGGIWGGKDGRVGWQERVDQGEVGEGEHRQEQPRTSDGKFTYNSVNGKETKYESRGKTVNPLLTNGENGIYIEESKYSHDVKDRDGNIIHRKGDTISKSSNGNNIKEQFKNKQGALYDRFASNFYQKGSQMATVSNAGKGKRQWKYEIRVSNDNIWDIARGKWDIEKGAFKGEMENWDQVKKGNPGKAGTAAKAEVKKTNAEQYLKDDRGGIKLVGETNQTLTDMEKRLKKVSGSQLKHSPAEIKQVRDLAAKKGFDFTAFTDEQIDQVMDEFLAKAGA